MTLWWHAPWMIAQVKHARSVMRQRALPSRWHIRRALGPYFHTGLFGHIEAMDPSTWYLWDQGCAPHHPL